MLKQVLKPGHRSLAFALLLCSLLCLGCNKHDISAEQLDESLYQASAGTAHYTGFAPAQDTLREVVHTLLVNERFELLEELGREFMSKNPSFGHYQGGRDLFFDSFADPNWGRKEYHEYYIGRWREKHPNSKLPLLALSEMQSTLLLPRVRRSYLDWQDIAYETQKVLAGLDTASRVPGVTDEPEYWLSRLRIGVYYGLPSEVLDAALTEVMKRDPKRWSAAALRAYGETPRWRGNSSGYKLYGQTVKRLSNEYGSEAAAACAIHIFHQTFRRAKPEFKKLGFNWEEIEKGFEGLLKERPDSSLLLNYRAVLATMLAPESVAKKYLQELGASWDEYVWNDKDEYFKVCREFGVTPSEGASFSPVVTAGPESRLLDSIPHLARFKLRTETRNLFLEERFAVLDRLAAHYHDDELMLANLYEGCTMAEGKVYIEKTLALCERWSGLFPQSSAARVTHASNLIRAAWDGRGGGYAYTVTDDGWKLFKSYLEQVPSLLEGLPDTYACELRVTAATGLSEAFSVVESACRRARELNPGATGALRNSLDYVLPRWHGKNGELETTLRKYMETYGDDIVVDLLSAHPYQRPILTLVPYELVDKGIKAHQKKHGVTPKSTLLRVYTESYNDRFEEMAKAAESALKAPDLWIEDRDALAAWVETASKGSPEGMFQMSVVESGQYRNLLPNPKRVEGDAFPVMEGRSLGIRIHYGEDINYFVRRTVRLEKSGQMEKGELAVQERYEYLPPKTIKKGRDELILWDITDRDKTPGVWTLTVNYHEAAETSEHFLMTPGNGATDVGVRVNSKGALKKDQPFERYFFLPESAPLEARIGTILGASVLYSGKPKSARVEWSHPNLPKGKVEPYVVNCEGVREGHSLPETVMIYTIEKAREAAKGFWTLRFIIDEKDIGKLDLNVR